MKKSVLPTASHAFFRYMPISERMREWGIAVTNIGHAITPPGSDYPPIRHPSHHHFTWESGRILNAPSFIYVTRGKGIFESASSQPSRVKAGQVLILFPGVWHRYRPDPATGWHEYWVDFAGQEADRLFKLANFNPGEPVVTVNLDEELMLSFTRLIELARTEPHRMELLLSAETTRILCRIIALASAGGVNAHFDTAAISQARASLLADLSSAVDLPKMARTAGMSYTSFRRRFKASTGFSPRQYQLEHRIHRAKSMLSQSTLPITQISDTLGFASVYYFSQFFKKKTGRSPIAFRKYVVSHRALAATARHARSPASAHP